MKCLFSFLTICLCALFVGFGQAQAKRKPKPEPITNIPMPNLVDTVIDEFAERMPTYRGRDVNEFGRWVGMQVRYPQSMLLRKRQGTVLVRFIIECDGTMSNFEILKAPHVDFAHEVLRALRRAQPWEPGIKDNQPVRVYCVVPIVFRLE